MIPAAPTITYPPELPVSQRREDLLAAIATNQVVIIAGETGSGKTTQIPKLCLELGRGRDGLIGHTQPRRIAARSVAERISHELGTEIGQIVGYAVRFTDRVGDNTLIKLMTDGILLAEIQRDRMLRKYDTIIIDEAHERSLNIDFLLGYLKQLLPARPDLKVIVTSATIEVGRFSDYFDGAPVIEVSGRSYPVEIRYRPINDPDSDSHDDPNRSADNERDQVSAICDAARELLREPTGDILVFLSGEREIRDTAEALNGLGLRDTEILPLYARLSSAEQHRVFQAHPGRRIVLATNVAETSLTVPGIAYVIDAGTARISRFSLRTKVQLLPIEAVSQASAVQRSGRCGRTSNGICIRLYSKEDFQSRPLFTDPEILRTNLASVILQMAALNLGPVADFGFIDPPDPRQIKDGIALLTELGALTSSTKLTDIGASIARLPVDPRLGRMILEADKRGCVGEVIVLAAALSIQDPRERPSEHQQAADAQHLRFADQRSDFVGYLNLWRYVREQQRNLSSNQFRRLCRNQYLNYLRIREWQDLYTQLRQIVKGMGIRIGDPTQAEETPTRVEQVHRSLLAGLLSHIGSRDAERRDYLGARNARFAIFPGSALFARPPGFVMAAELVETSRLWGRVTAAIQPEWAEELAGHLVRTSYSEPRWERRRGAAVASERVTLYGVTLVAARIVAYHRIDPELARELFIRHALVQHEWDSRHAFLSANRNLVDQVADLENRVRRRGLLVEDDLIFDFYDQRIPASVVTGRHFDSWWRKTRRRQPELLQLTLKDLLAEEDINAADDRFPDVWTSGSFEASLAYRFDPGSETDGVTIAIPLPLLASAADAGLDWQVPGLRQELVVALLRSLPKDYRRLLMPIPQTAEALVRTLPTVSDGRDLTTALTEELLHQRGFRVPAHDWDLDKLPPHLRPTYEVVAEDGAVLGRGKDLGLLQRELSGHARAELTEAASEVVRESLTSWDVDEIARTVTRRVGGHEVMGYPGLVDENGRVALRVFDSASDQAQAQWAGVRRLLALNLPAQHRQITAAMSARDKVSIARTPYPSVPDLLADCTLTAIDSLMTEFAGNRDGGVWTRADFDALREYVAPRLTSRAVQIGRVVTTIITRYQEVGLLLNGAHPASLDATVADVRRQVDALIFDGFVRATPPAQLPHLTRYLSASVQRLQDAPASLSRDHERQAVVEVAVRDLADLKARLGGERAAEFADIGWMIEELRVSVFAQKLGTPYPISIPRIHKAMDAIDPR